MNQPVPTKLGKYEVLSLLGAGAQASVYRARQPGLEREVAIKVIAFGGTAAADFLARFEQEAQVSARLEHPNILPVHDCGQQDGFAYFVMRLVRGGTLAQRMAQGRVPDAQALAILEQIARALDHAHSLHVVHRDVKPANILLSGDGQALLSDFGIAKLLEGSTLQSEPGSNPCTPAYASPDPLAGEAPDGRSDQYSLAVIAYELLDGKRPFNSDSARELIYQHAAKPPPFSGSWFDARPQVVHALRRALAKEREQRFDSCLEFVSALRAGLEAAPAQLHELETREHEADHTHSSSPPPLPNSAPPPVPAIAPPSASREPQEPQELRSRARRVGLRAWVLAGAFVVLIFGAVAWSLRPNGPAHAGEPTDGPRVVDPQTDRTEPDQVAAEAPTELPNADRRNPVAARPLHVAPWSRFRVVVALDESVDRQRALGIPGVITDEIVAPLLRDLDADPRFAGASLSDVLFRCSAASVSNPAQLAERSGADLVVGLSYELIGTELEPGLISDSDTKRASIRMAARLLSAGSRDPLIQVPSVSRVATEDLGVAVRMAVADSSPTLRTSIMERVRDWADAALSQGIECRIALLVEGENSDGSQALRSTLENCDAVVEGSLRRESDGDFSRDQKSIRVPRRGADGGAPLVLPLAANSEFSLWSVRIRANRATLVAALEPALREQLIEGSDEPNRVLTTRVHEDILAFLVSRLHPEARGLRDGGSAPLPADAAWAPLVMPSGQLFTSHIVSHATENHPTAGTDGILGDAGGMIGIEITAPTAGVRVAVELECAGLWDLSTFEVELPVAGKRYLILPKLAYRFADLVRVRQTQPMSVTFRVLLGGEHFEERVETVTVRSIHDCLFGFQFTGADGTPTFVPNYPNFAAYVNENHPALESLRKECLRQGSVDSFSGYQGGKAGVMAQVEALWSELQRRGIKYSSITATVSPSESTIAQHVRFVEESLRGEQANCVDGSVLFASALEQIGIHAFLVLAPGHCFLAFLSDEQDPTSITGLETTMLSDRPFEEAVSVGTQQLVKALTNLDKDPINYALVPIGAARAAGVQPLPYLENN
ncbi:MAG: protein kinase [Planctomycetes bacterium]|nr:protein kinase [Planctomycetota bacterium]